MDPCTWCLLLILLVQICWNFLISVDSLSDITFNVESLKSSSSYYVFRADTKSDYGAECAFVHLKQDTSLIHFNKMLVVGEAW